MAKMNTIFGAGTFPKSLRRQACLPFRMPWRWLELIITPGKSWVDHVKSLMYTTDFIPLRVLIFKTRSNHVIRKHNSVLSRYILGCKIFINWLLRVLCRGPCRGTCQRTTDGSWFSPSTWRASSGPQVDDKCRSPTQPSCWSLRWVLLGPSNHSTTRRLSCTLLVNLTAQRGHLELEANPGVESTDGTFVICRAVCYSRRLDRADPSQQEPLENTERGGRQPLCAELGQRTLEKPAAEAPEFPVGRLGSSWKHFTQERGQKLTVLKRTRIRKSKLFRVWGFGSFIKSNRKIYEHFPFSLGIILIYWMLFTT